MPARTAAALIFLSLGLSFAEAQSPNRVLTGNIVEAYSPSVNVGSQSGALAGLWLGLPAGALDVTSVRLGVPSATAAQNLCFSATTRDGQYTARGPARVAKGASAVLAVSNLQQSKFAEQLRRYSGQDFAVTARWGTDCAVSPTAPYLPVIGDENSTRLVVAINSGHAIKVAASLAADGVREIVGMCNAFSEDRSTAFDTLCTFELPAEGAARAWNLALMRLPRAGPRRIDDFVLLLPR